MVNSEKEGDGAVASFSIGENNRWFIGRMRIDYAVKPRIGVASGDAVDRRATVVNS